MLLSYIANTSRTHHACTHTHARAHTPARTRTHPHPSPFRLSLFHVLVRPTMTELTPPFRRWRWRSMAGRCFIQMNSRAGESVLAIVLGVEGKSSVCLICMKYIIICFHYYHYQPGSNIIIVYCKHITHAPARTRAQARTRVQTHTHTHRRRSGNRYSMGLWQFVTYPETIEK